MSFRASRGDAPIPDLSQCEIGSDSPPRWCKARGVPIAQTLKRIGLFFGRLLMNYWLASRLSQFTGGHGKIETDESRSGNTFGDGGHVGAMLLAPREPKVSVASP